MINQNTPARTNIRAIARSGVVPHHHSKRILQEGLASQGMIANCVNGPIRNAVKGEAIFSID